MVPNGFHVLRLCAMHPYQSPRPTQLKHPKQRNTKCYRVEKNQSAQRGKWAVRIKQKVCWLSISCHFNIKTMQMYGECKCAKLSSKMVSNGFVHSLQSPWCIEKQNNAKFCNMKVKIYVCIKSMPSLKDGNDCVHNVGNTFVRADVMMTSWWNSRLIYIYSGILLPIYPEWWW